MILILVNYNYQVINVLKHKPAYICMVGSKLKGHPSKKIMCEEPSRGGRKFPETTITTTCSTLEHTKILQSEVVSL